MRCLALTSRDPKKGATNVFRTTPRSIPASFLRARYAVSGSDRADASSHASRQRPPLLALRAGVGEEEKEQEQEKDNPGKALLRGRISAISYAISDTAIAHSFSYHAMRCPVLTNARRVSGLMGAVEAMGGSMIDYRTPEERGEEEGGSASADGKEKAKEEEEAGRKIERVTSESVEELGQVASSSYM